MENSKKELSYYKLRLQELLNTSFPEKTADQDFIHQRSSWAAQAYEEAFLAGNTIDQCNRIAENILFQNLHFSKFDTVFLVVCNEFDTLMVDEELRPFALKMLPICKPVFTKYELADDFAYSSDFENLYTEITGTITLWIDENGLQ